jgi:hypothetical protein
MFDEPFRRNGAQERSSIHTLAGQQCIDFPVSTLQETRHVWPRRRVNALPPVRPGKPGGLEFRRGVHLVKASLHKNHHNQAIIPLCFAAAGPIFARQPS